MGFYNKDKINDGGFYQKKDYNGYAWLEAKDVVDNLKKPILNTIFGVKRPVIIDGKLDEPHFQEVTGDCYVVAASNSMSYVPEGQKAIEEQVFKDPISGMIGVKVEDVDNIEKIYYFTEDEIRDAETQFNFEEAYTDKGEYIFGFELKKSGRLSRGDHDLVAIELAYEQVRVEKMLEMFDAAGGEDNYKSFILQMDEATKTNDKEKEQQLKVQNAKLYDLYKKNKSIGVVVKDTENPLNSGRSETFIKTILGDKVIVTNILNQKIQNGFSSETQVEKNENLGVPYEQSPTNNNEGSSMGVKVQVSNQSTKKVETQSGEMQTSGTIEPSSTKQQEDCRITYVKTEIKSVKDYGNPNIDSIIVTFDKNKGGNAYRPRLFIQR